MVVCHGKGEGVVCIPLTLWCPCVSAVGDRGLEVGHASSSGREEAEETVWDKSYRSFSKMQFGFIIFFHFLLLF